MKNYYFILVILLFIFSCSSSNPSSPVVKTISQGNWTGTTVMGDAITFTVAQSKVNNFQLTMIYDFQSLLDTVTWNLTDINITNDSFYATDSQGNNPSYTFTINGKFTPPNSVSGMISVHGVYHPDSSSTHIINPSQSWNASFNN